MITRSSVAAALVLLLASPVAGQEPTSPSGEPTSAMMQHTMDCMHASGGTEMPAMPMQGMQGTRMGGDAAGTGMPMDRCPGCGSQARLTALFGRPTADLALTAEQRTAVDAVLSRARDEALALLTAEQRTALEAHHAAPGHMCMMHAHAPTEAPQD